MKREEIAEALREAGFAEANVHLFCGGKMVAATEIQDEWNEKAFQVENMRCETCAKEFYRISTSSDPTPCPWRGCGGCFQHEPKVKWWKKD